MQLCGFRCELLDVLRELCDFLPESTDGLHEQLSECQGEWLCECLGEWLDGQLGQVSGPSDGPALGVGLDGLLQDVVQEGGRLDEQQDGWQCEELGGLGQCDGWQLGGQGGGLELVLEGEAMLADDEGRMVRRN